MSNARAERSYDEVIVDRLLLLYLSTTMRSSGRLLSGDLKLQKLVYKSEENMLLGQDKGFNYFFIRYKMGPWSRELQEDAKELTKMGFLNKEQYAYMPADRTYKLIEDADEIFKKNRFAVQIIDQVIREFGEYKGKELKVLMYAYPKPDTKIPIQHIKLGDPILQKLSIHEAKNRFILDEDWLDTLGILFNPYMYSAINKGINNLKKEFGRPFRPVVR
ncbi:MAG: Panacea domain-containing protein [Flavobacteriaceae bacterium]|nr:Panacea domain-containing protein [Flavobacteriaceae bacterium]